MRTRDDMLKSGMSAYDIARVERTQKVYDFAMGLTKEHVPGAPEYLQVAMTRELLLAATGER